MTVDTAAITIAAPRGVVARATAMSSRRSSLVASAILSEFGFADRSPAVPGRRRLVRDRAEDSRSGPGAGALTGLRTVHAARPSSTSPNADTRWVTGRSKRALAFSISPRSSQLDRPGGCVAITIAEAGK